MYSPTSLYSLNEKREAGRNDLPLLRMQKSNKVKFQWSKVASVLGSYEDFIKTYGMSISAAGFSAGQLEAQLNTITRKFEQLKATLTGIATGMGASGLSAYIKNILSSLNAFAKSMQQISTSTYETIGAIVKFVAGLGSVIVVVRTLAVGMQGLTTAYTMYKDAVIAGTIATEGWAVATTAATGGLNILLAVIIAGVAAFLGYNAVVGDSIEEQDKLKQSSEDLIAVEQQKMDMMRKEEEFVETLIRAHFKLAEQVDDTSNSEEKNAQIKRDLAATDKELAEIVGEDGLKRIKTSKDVNSAINTEKEVFRKKCETQVANMIATADAEIEFTQNTIQGIVDRIDALKSETSAWGFWARAINAAMGVYAGFLDIQEAGVDWTLAHPDQVDTDAYLQAQARKESIANERAWAQKRPASVEKELAELEGKRIEAESKLSNLKYNRLNMQLQLANIQNPDSDLRGEAQDDSGVISESGGSGAGSKGKGGSGKSGAGAREADNSPEAMGYRYLTSKGLDKNMVLGLLGNIMQESGFNPDADNGSHRGLIQWDYDDASRTGRWYDFMDDYLARMRGISEEQYYAMDVQQKRALQYDFAIFEMRQGKEQEAYQKILDSIPTTPEDWASLINQHYERSGEAPGSPVDMQRQRNAREYAERFSGKNGELNYTDGEKAIENAYKEAKKLFDLELERLKTERQKEGLKVSAEDELKLYEKVMGISKGRNPYAVVEAAQKDYVKQLANVAKEEAKRADSAKKAAEIQISAIEKMADAEVAFAEKMGFMSKKDVINYNYRKNEREYNTKMPILAQKLGSTVDESRGSYQEILEAYRQLIYAQNDLDRERYAQRIMWLSKDVDATSKTLDEMLKLEEQYQSKRASLQREAFEEADKYTIGFVDSFTNAFQSGLESMLNGTKSFGEAMKDIFKSLVSDIIKMFTQDLAQSLHDGLMNLLHPKKKTGKTAGSYQDSFGFDFSSMFGGKKKGKGGGGFDLMGWGKSNLSSLLLGGKGKKGKGGLNLMDWFTGSGGSLGLGFGKKGGKSPLVEALVPKNLGSQLKQAVAQPLNQLKNAVGTSVNQMQALTTTGMNEITATSTQGWTLMGTTHQAVKGAEVATVVEGNAAIVASEEEAQAATATAMSETMMWIMAALALLSIFMGLGSGGGESKSESYSSANLGRSPDSYYMTPTPVMQSTTFNVPSFDIGGNIEQDMFAMVHKGEMVLTPEQADVIRGAARSGGGVAEGSSANANIKSNIQVSTVDSRGFEKVLRDYNRQLSKNVKRGVRNGYLTAKGLM